MKILMLGNSFTFFNQMPQLLSELTGADVVHHTRGAAGGASEPESKIGRPHAGGAPERAVGLCGAPGDVLRPDHISQKLIQQRPSAVRTEPAERGRPPSLRHLGLSEGRR